VRSTFLRALAGMSLVLALGCSGSNKVDEAGSKDKQEQSGGSEPTWEKRLDLPLIPPDCFAAIIMHPQRILRSAVTANSAEIAAMEKSAMFAQFVASAGFDPRTLEQVALLFFASEPGGSARAERPTPALILRWPKPIDGKGLLQKWHKDYDLQEATYEGKTIITAVRSVGPGKTVTLPDVFHLPDERTMVVCVGEEALKQMLSASRAPSPLREHLRTLSADNDLIGAVVVEPAGKMGQALARDAAGLLPPGLSEVARLPRHLKTATLTVNLADETALKLVLAGTSAEANARLADLAAAFQEMLKQMSPQFRAQMTGEQGRPPDPVKRVFFDLAEQTAKGLRVTKGDNRVELSVRMKRPEALVNVFPAFLRTRELAEEADKAAFRRYGLIQVGFATLNCEKSQKRFPAAASRDRNGKPLLSWRVHILPYLNQQALYERFHLDEPWDSPHNKELIPSMPKVFCHAPKDAAAQGLTTVMVFVGQAAPFGDPQGPRLAQIADGARSTIMIVHAGKDREVPWTKPEDLPFDPADPAVALGTIPAGGFEAVFFDGQPIRIARDVDPGILRALITHAGGEVIDSDTWDRVLHGGKAPGKRPAIKGGL